jgi:hypothetical protein
MGDHNNACLLKVQAISDQVAELGLLPGPIVWEGIGCTGRSYPAAEFDSGGEFQWWQGEGTTGDSKTLDFDVASAYVPSSVSARFTKEDGAHKGLEVKKSDVTGGSDEVEMLVGDARLTNGMALTRRVHFERLRDDPAETVVINMCMGQEVYFGGQPFGAYRPQSAACDSLMTTFCAKGTNIDDKRQCGCMRDRRDLAAEYPGATLPVTCMGTNCALGYAYRTRAMLEEQCSQRICELSVELTGEDLSNSTDSRVFCGQDFYQFADGRVVLAKEHRVVSATDNSVHYVTDAPTSEAEESDRHYTATEIMPFWVWIVLLVTLAAAAVGAGLWARFRRSK